MLSLIVRNALCIFELVSHLVQFQLLVCFDGAEHDSLCSGCILSAILNLKGAWFDNWRLI